MSRPDYLHSYFCARCYKFYRKETAIADSMGRRACPECHNLLRVKPRRKGSKEMYRLLEQTR